MSTNPKAVVMATVIAAAFPDVTVEREQNVITMEGADGERFIVTVETVFTPSASAPLCCPDCIGRCTGYCSLCHNKEDHDPACLHPDHPTACKFPEFTPDDLGIGGSL